MSKVIRSARWPITLIFFGVIATGVMGLFRLQAEVEVEKLFRPDSDIIQSLTLLETTLAPMDQTEVLLVFDDAEANRMFERVEFIRSVEAAITQVDHVSVAYSIAKFLPKEPVIRRLRDRFKRDAYRDYLDREKHQLTDGNLMAVDSESGAQIWRVSVRFPFTQKIDFERLRDEVEAATEKVVLEFKTSQTLTPPPNLNSSETETETETENEPIPDEVTGRFSPPRVIFTGHTYLFHHAQLTLLQDLFQNFVLAFVIITPILMLVLRSFRIGLIAMLPNVFPTVAVFGALGWLGYPIDLALAMTASVALGIAVDDTTHFLIRFREYGGNLNRIDKPIQQTLAQCGPAMLHTTLIASASLMTYYFSDMLVVSRFSWAISLLLAVALVADVLMLPAALFVFGNTGSADHENPTDPKSN